MSTSENLGLVGWYSPSIYQHSVWIACSHLSPVYLQIEQEKLASLKKQDEDKDKRDKEEKESSREKRERSRSPRRYDITGAR